MRAVDAREQARLEHEIARWQKIGERPAGIDAPGPGQESVWDFPRPPRVDEVSESLRVEFAGKVIATTQRGLRVVETAGAPVYYFPPGDVRRSWLTRSTETSRCEWKGHAAYWTVRVHGREARNAAWSYPEPFPTYEALTDYVAFYVGPMDGCYVGEERVRPQPGGVYGGWVTDHLAGPIKGEPGSERW